jgi:hypothetical protein
VADRYLWGPDVAEVVDSAGAPTDSSLARDPANEKFFAGLDASTSIVTKLTTASGAAEMEPAWSPVGDRTAYVRRAGITGRADLRDERLGERAGTG